MVLDESGTELEGEAEGYIAFKQPWPGIMRTVYGNHERFEHTYFKRWVLVLNVLHICLLHPIIHPHLSIFLPTSIITGHLRFADSGLDD